MATVCEVRGGIATACDTATGRRSRMVGKLPWDYPMRVFFEASKVVSEHLGRKRINGLDLDDLLLSIVSMCLYPFQAMPTRDTKLKSFIQRHKRHVSAVVVRAVGG